MKKSIKNTIMVGMAAVLIGTTAITFAYADRNNAPSMVPYSQSFEQQDSGNPLESFGNDNQQNLPPLNRQDNQNSQNNQDSQNNQKRQSDKNAQRPQGPPSDNRQAPSNADDAQSENDAETEGNGTAQKGTAATGDAEIINVNKNGMPSRNNMPRQSNFHAIVILCYLFGALQIMIVAAIALYLFLSKGNSLSFQQILTKFKK